MADPEIVGGIRAQVVFQGPSGDPQDRYVNSWAFANVPTAAATEGDESTVADRLEEFYTEPVSAPGVPSGNSVRGFMGAQIGEVAVVKTYQLEESAPREPTEWEIDWGVTSAASLPSELAVALTMFSDRPLPRNRGRLYIGPLRQTAIDSTVLPPRPSPTLLGTLAAAATRLAAYDTGPRWMVISQADGLGKFITGGWVDDAFDIQRRRGEDPTTRREWPA